MNKNIEQEELARWLHEEKEKHFKEILYAFSLSHSLEEQRISNNGEDIDMKNYFAKIGDNMEVLSKKIFDAMERG